MTNHPARSTNAKIARNYIAARWGVEKVRITKGGEVHAYGPMPNSTFCGWYLAGYVDDLAKEARVSPGSDELRIARATAKGWHAKAR